MRERVVIDCRAGTERRERIPAGELASDAAIGDAAAAARAALDAAIAADRARIMAKAALDLDFAALARLVGILPR